MERLCGTDRDVSNYNNLYRNVLETNSSSSTDNNFTLAYQNISHLSTSLKMGHAELGPEDIDENVNALVGAIKRTWAEFCVTSSIHGLKYTQDKETNRVMRFIWLLIVIVMFSCAVVMVFTFYVDYRSSPTRMNVENDHAPIAGLYFPGVTICPEVLYNLNRSARFLQTLILPANVTHRNVLDELYIGYGFINDDIRFKPYQIEMMQSILELNNLTISQFVNELNWKYQDLFFRCRFQGEIVNCTDLFQIARAFYGHCWSFNLNQTGIRFTARYATHYGLLGGLSMILQYRGNDLSSWRTHSRGFKLLLHENNAFPSAHAVSKYVPLNEEVFSTVRPVETVTSLAVRNLAKEERHCVFGAEFKLRYFHNLDGNNCALNCRVLNMIKFCGCLTFFFVNKLTRGHRICDFTDIPCLVDEFANIIGRERKNQCPCPNLCEMTDYDVQMTNANLQINSSSTVDEFYAGIQENFSVVHIYMHSQVYRRVKQDLLSNTVTLVANLGSAFSLFVGMSMVSLVEIVYYFSVILRKYYHQEVKARDQLAITKSSALSDGDKQSKTIKIN